MQLKVTTTTGHRRAVRIAAVLAAPTVMLASTAVRVGAAVPVHPAPSGVASSVIQRASAALRSATARSAARSATTANPQGNTITDPASTGKAVEISSATRTTDPATLTITVNTYGTIDPTVTAFEVILDTTLSGLGDYEVIAAEGLSGPSATSLEGGLMANTPRLVKVAVTSPTPTSVAITFPRSMIGGSINFDWTVVALNATAGTTAGSISLAADIAPDHPTALVRPGAQRVAGADRVATSIGASFFYDGTAHAVVLARSDNFPDALAGAPLAAAKDGPLMLTPTAALDSRVLAEIQRVLPAGGTIYVLGGLGALSQAVSDAITAAGYQISRFSGIDRFDTALKVASALGDPGTIFLTTGMDFPDALSAGAAAAAKSGAVLLTDGAKLPPSVTTYLAAHGADTLFAVGGPAAAADPAATSVSGTDRYATSQKVASTFFNGPTVLGLASGANFPDALAGGATMAIAGGPLLLTDPATLPTPIHDYLVANKATILPPVVFGGTSAVSDGVITSVNAALV